MSDTRSTNLYTALLAAQRAFGPVLKNAQNPHLKNKYADLGAVLDAIEEPLWANGLIIVQRFAHDQGGAILVTELIHAESGQSIASELPIVAKDPTDPQKVGSAITYARRYSLLALLGLRAEDDDDGNAAAQPRQAPRQQAAPATNGSGEAKTPPTDEQLLTIVNNDQRDPEVRLRAATTYLGRAGNIAELNQRDANLTSLPDADRKRLYRYHHTELAKQFAPAANAG